MLRSARRSVADVIFIVSADLSRIGKLRELDLEHRSSRKGLAARIAPSGERNPSMILWHVCLNGAKWSPPHPAPTLANLQLCCSGLSLNQRCPPGRLAGSHKIDPAVGPPN